MKFVCNATNMFDAVSKVSRAVSVKEKTNVLGGIKIDAKADILTFFATDNEISIETKIVADIFEEGEIIVPAKYLFDFLKKLDMQDVEVTTTQKNEINIKYGDSEGNLQLFDLQKFPKPDFSNECSSFSMKAQDFSEIISMSQFCAATDDSRPIFKGALLEFEDDTVTIVALDGFRMAYIKKQAFGNVKKQLIVPIKSLVEISKFIANQEEIEIFADANHIMVELDGAKIISRLYNGEFINYKNIIPKNHEIKAIIETKPFAQGLERVAVLLENMNSKMVKFELKNNNITMLCNSEIGSIREKLPCVLSGTELVIAFNARFFADLVKYVKDEFITLYFSNASSPCVVKAVDDAGDYLYMILPIRVV